MVVCTKGSGMSNEWDSVRVSRSVKERATRIRDSLLRNGSSVLPARWRGRIEVPPSSTPRKVAARKLGVGQILDLALAALEREIDLVDAKAKSERDATAAISEEKAP